MTTEAILKCLRTALAGIAPDAVATPDGRTNLQTAGQLVNLLLARQQLSPRLQRDRDQRLRLLLGSESGDGDPVTAASRLLSRIIRSGASDGRLVTLAGALALEPQAIQDRTDALGDTRRAGDSSPARGPDEAAVARYLGAHHPEVGAAVRVEVLPGGYSRETILVETAGDGPDVVFRKVVNGRDPEWLPSEWNVLRFVAGRGLRAPQPLWYEDDPSHLGNVFFAVTRMPGTSQAFAIGRTGGVNPGIALDLARLLARLHRTDTRGLGTTPVLPMTTVEEVRRAIDALSKPESLLPRPDDPLFEPLLDWLRARIPAPPPRPVLVHGDAGFHNILVQGDAVTALLDWERSHLGDPAEELAYVRPGLEGVIAWDDFLREYATAGGSVPEAGRLHFYTVWQNVWRASVCHDFRLRLLRENEPRSPEGISAFIYGPRFTAAAARTALQPDAPPGS
ncbi:MAG: phosphotransferase [Steroidobacteraceae bacterium]